MWSDFHFIRPYWLLALLPLAALLWYLLRHHISSKRWEKVCDPALLPYILANNSGRKRYMPIVLLSTAMLLAIIALAGPTWERIPQPVFQKESALVIALDLSYSMYTDDVSPSRLIRAQFEISDLLDLRQDGQTALLVYAGSAFTVTPLTNDIKTIKSQLSLLTPDIMPLPGSATDLAIEKALELLTQAGITKGNILFITDDIDLKHKPAFTKAKNKGYPISILGVGTENGKPIKLPNGNFLKNRDGSIIIPKLNPAILGSIATVAGGHYQSSQFHDQDIQKLNEFFDTATPLEDSEETELNTDKWHELGPWIVLLILPITMLAFRRGWLCVLICVLSFNSEQLLAFDWNDLWLNKNQRAMKALENQEYSKAADLFQDQRWQAAAQYKANDYAAAEALLNEHGDIDSLYNKATAIAKQGRYAEAIQIYNEVLEQRPTHEDAKFNKTLLEDALEKQPSAQQESAGEQQETEQQMSEQQATEQQATQQQMTEQQTAEQQEATQQQANQQTDEQDATEQQAYMKDENGEQDDTDDSEKQEHLLSKAPEEQEDQDEQDQRLIHKQDEENNDENDADQLLTEEQQIAEQWLRRIPDDPAGLLKRKFQYQYQRQNQPTTEGKYW